MKRYPLLALTISFALIQLASAEDEKQKAARNAQQSAAVHRAPPLGPRAAAYQGRVQAQRNAAIANQKAWQSRQYQQNAAAVARSNAYRQDLALRTQKAALQQAQLEQNQAAANRNWRTRTGNNWNGNGRGNNWNGSGQGNNWNGSGRGNNWNGSRHGNWDRSHHNRSWWRSRYNRFALFGGGYYYWNSGYWYPAYGYDPYFTTYSYDAPIYSYNDQDPGQVIANVQVELQRRGYDPGSVDGTYGPMTRRALLNYQSDTGLPVTGEIDEDTLSSLGLQ